MGDIMASVLELRFADGGSIFEATVSTDLDISRLRHHRFKVQ